jgi:tRNA/tmRNA/rRNA uracil-C5-methylase (TrmA/RlmC/RlmD family)
VKHNVDLQNGELRNRGNNCYLLRRNILNKLSIKEYMQTFPVLLQQEAFTLLLDDFSQIYPGNSEKLYEKWGQLSENILKEAKNKNIIDSFSGSGGMYSYSSQNCLLT